MAERTQIPQLDDAIEEFLARGIYLLGQSTFPLEALRRAEKADGICSHIAEQFVEFLCERGFAASTYWQHVDWLGYQDRSIYGYHEHCVTWVEAGRVRLAIDWTAAQYGYDSFPLVQRQGPGGWMRAWDHEGAPVIIGDVIAARWSKVAA